MPGKKFPEIIDWEGGEGASLIGYSPNAPIWIILDKNFKPLCKKGQCKDYFADFIWVQTTKKISIYAKIDPNPKCLDEFYLVVKKTYKYDIKNVIGIIRQLEKFFKIKTRCIIYDHSDAIILKPGSEWVRRPSISTMLLQIFRHCKLFDKNKQVEVNMEEGSLDNNFKIQNRICIERLKQIKQGGEIIENSWEYYNYQPHSNVGLNSNSITIKIKTQ